MNVFRSAIAAIGLILFSNVAMAQTVDCAPYEQVLSVMSEQHGETPVAMGIIDGTNGGVIVMFQNEKAKTATFIAVVTTPNGQQIGCLLAGVTEWNPYKGPMPEQGA